MRYQSLLVSLVGGSLLLVGCSDPQKSAAQHAARAEQYLHADKYAEAVIEFRTAVSYSPKDGELHARLAKAYAKFGDIRNSFQELLKAADLLPNRADVQINAGQMLLAAGRFEDAKSRARAVLERDPNNVAATILMGNALVGLKDFDNAAVLGKKAADLDPDQAGVYQNLGVLELVRGNADSAEAAFKRALEIDPHSVSACLALGGLYRATQARAKAEEAYRRALSIDPASVTANQAMASLYVESDRAAEAEPYLVAAARSTDVDPALALADYYLALGRADNARETLARIIRTKEGFAPASVRLAVIEYLAGHRVTGHQLLDDAIKKQPKNALALAMKARLLLSDNKVEEALTTAKSAVSADPRAPEAQIVLGRVHLVRREISDARKAFNEALRLGPQSIEARLELARLHLRSGEGVTALDYAQQVLEARPHSLEAMLLVVQAYAAQIDDLPKAEAALNEAAAKFPNAPQVYTMRGNLALLRKDTNAARREWEHAVKLDPANVDALGGLVTLLMTAKKPAEARALVDAHIKDRPNSPGLVLLGAKVRLVNNDPRAAEEMLKRVLQLDPSNLQAYGLIGQVYVSQHRVQEAKRDFTEVIRRAPESVEAHTMMGLLSAADHDIDGAIGWYEKAVRLNERAAVAANNLAWLHVTRNDNLDAAMKLAESAAREMPRQPEFQDTLGWIYYKKQQSRLAIGALQKAVDLDPTNATYRYHLGMTYALDGSDSKARRELQQALKLDPHFPEAAEIKNALSKLVY